MTIKPLNDRVLIEPAKAEDVVGGIVIPDSAKEKPLKGKVRVIPFSMASMLAMRLRLTVRNC